MMENRASMMGRIMSDMLSGVDPSILTHLRLGTDWTEIQILSDPFVVCRRDRYIPAVLVEEMNTEEKRLLFVSAGSLGQCLEPIRARRGALVGLNVRLRKKGDDRFSTYEVEELAE